MSSKWQPDDSLLVRGKGGTKGAQRIKAALEKHKVSSASRVITSRDARMNDVKRTLKRPRASMPPDVEQWQLPVTLGPRHAVLIFTGRMKPGTKIPAHAHKNDLFRVVISGSLKYRGKTLRVGDWMFVPAGQSYSLQAGPKGVVTFITTADRRPRRGRHGGARRCVFRAARRWNLRMWPGACAPRSPRLS